MNIQGSIDDDYVASMTKTQKPIQHEFDEAEHVFDCSTSLAYPFLGPYTSYQSLAEYQAEELDRFLPVIWHSLVPYIVYLSFHSPPKSPTLFLIISHQTFCRLITFLLLLLPFSISHHSHLFTPIMIDTVLPLPASLAIAAYTLAYTPPNSKLRPVAGLVIAIFNWIAAQSTIARSFPGFIGPEYILGWILASNNWLNLARLQYNPPTEEHEQPHSRLKWAIYQIFDTRWSVSVSQMPFFDKNRPQWVPSRQLFLIWKIWTVTWCGITMYAIKELEPSEVAELLFSPAGFLDRLSVMTAKEAVLRIYYGLGLMVSSYCCLCFMHAVCGFIAVALFRDDPAGWRPLHGSPSEALGMRGFYSKFWHHCMRKGFTTHAVFIINDILRFPRQNTIARYLIVIVTFLLSGLYHAALTPDLPWQCSMLQIGYQLRIVGAIVFEDFVSILWRRFAPRSLRLQDDKAPKENDVVIISKSTAVSSSKDPQHKDLRRRNERNESRGYSDSPTSVDPTNAGMPERNRPLLSPSSIFLYGIGYLWTVSFIIWANSTLVWSTNQCVLNRTWDEERKTLLL